MSRIVVQNLGKKYKHYPTRWGRLVEALSGGHLVRHRPHWVLRGVTFDVGPGESVGIIGLNGAGKSTLLKILTGTTVPTEGSVQCEGRVAALLELGMGFHPDFTGRQNAVMGCQMMGLPRSLISEVLPGIVDFSELDAYIDEPYRTYSSGMQMRLAFSVATAVRPDILIVDEALSVGDIFFQHKCMQRIRHFQEQGTTLLLVSHSPDTIRMMCQRGIMLANGKIERMGDATSVMDYYRASEVLRMDAPSMEQPELTDSAPLLDTRERKVVLANRTSGAISADIIGDTNSIHSGDRVSIRITTTFSRHYNDPHIGFGIRNKMGITVYEANTYTLGDKTRPVSPGESLSATFSFPCRLSPGTYELVVGVADGGYGFGSFEHSLFFDQSFMLFEIAVGKSSGWAGIYDLQPEVVVE